MVRGTRGRGSSGVSSRGAAKVGRVVERWSKVEGRGKRGGVEVGSGNCKESFGRRKGNLSMHHKLRAYSAHH